MIVTVDGLLTFFAHPAGMARITLLLLASLSAAACGGSVPRASALWDQGDYRAAVASAFEAATDGDPQAQFILGEAYRLGRSVRPDMVQALSWYSRAARQGHLASAEALGELLVHTRQSREAVPWLTLAASHNDARATALLAVIYCTGDGADTDLVLCASLTKKAAALGSPEAKARLAMMDDTAAPVDVSSPPPAQLAAVDVQVPPLAMAKPAITAGSSPSGHPMALATLPEHRNPAIKAAYLQVGAFRSAGNAQRAIAALRSRMQNAAVQYRVAQANGFYKVWLITDGRHATYRASARLTAIRWQHFVSGHRLGRA